jgi:predicted transcriptional regulator
LISIKPKHVEDILSGKKTVELRRRALRIPAGARVWVYSTLPDAHVRMVAKVEQLEEWAPSTIWRKNSSKMALSKSEYDGYVEGCSKVCALHLSEVRPLSKPLSLQKLRDKQQGFNPPQFFKFLDEDSVLVRNFLYQLPA